MSFGFLEICRPLPPFDTECRDVHTFAAEGDLLVLLVKSGQCSVQWGQDALLAAAGGLVAAPGEIKLICPRLCAVQGVWLEGSAAREFGGGMDAPLLLDCAAVPEAVADLDTLVHRTGPGGEDPEGSALAYGLLCRLLAARGGAGAAPSLAAAAIALIREHYADVYGVEELAAELNVNKSHLIRSFHEATGTSPGRYLTEVRVQAAKRLLAHRDYSLDVVATLCGFSGGNYLNKVFKKVTGQTPGQWRARPAPLPEGGDMAQGEEMLYL